MSKYAAHEPYRHTNDAERGDPDFAGVPGVRIFRVAAAEGPMIKIQPQQRLPSRFDKHDSELLP